MNTLRQSDLQATLDFLGEAESVRGPDPFPPELLERLRRLVPCDIVSFCELDRTRERLIADICSTGERFEDDPEDEELQSFWRLRHQHPICAHQDRTGNFSAKKLSDFLTRRELRRLEMYSEWFATGEREEFELDVGISSPPWHTKVFLFNRGDRDFRERDRAVLDTLRPHLAHLYDSAKKRRLANALAAGSDAEGELVVLDSADAIDFASSRALRLFRNYYADTPGPRLPGEVEDWLLYDRSCPNTALTAQRGDRRLVITKLNGDDRALLLNEEAVADDALSALSFREWQVLGLVEEGKSNAEIAAALWIAPATVRTHLENIYAKLHVHSRTAAVARVRRLNAAQTA